MRRLESLKVERDNLSKAYDVHQKLVEELLKENDCTELQMLFINIPIYLFSLKVKT